MIDVMNILATEIIREKGAIVETIVIMIIMDTKIIIDVEMILMGVMNIRAAKILAIEVTTATGILPATEQIIVATKKANIPIKM